MNRKNLYILIAFASLINAFALKNTWGQCTVDPHDFQYSMTVTGELTIDGTPSTDINDSVFTYVDGECRGSAPVTYDSSVDMYFVLLTIFSNSISGESVTVKFKDASSSTVIESPNTILFEADANIGTLSTPYMITNSALSTSNIEGIGGKSIAVYPNPTQGVVELSFADYEVRSILISDITGKVVFEKAVVQQDESLDMSGWKEGIYIVRFQTGKEVVSTKIIKE